MDVDDVMFGSEDRCLGQITSIFKGKKPSKTRPLKKAKQGAPMRIR